MKTHPIIIREELPQDHTTVEALIELSFRYCMAAELRPGGLTGIHGTVEYSKPFME